MVSIASPSVGAPVDWMARVRRPLAATAAALIAIDLIGLGMHLADAANPGARAEQAPRAQARTNVTAPNAVVDSETVEAAAGTGRTRPTTPSGGFIGPVAPPVVTTAPPSNTATPTPGTNPPAPAPPVPLVQANVGVPALGANVQLGLGDGGCTTVDLTLLALGNCPAPEGDGAVILQLGGSLLGG